MDLVVHGRARTLERLGHDRDINNVVDRHLATHGAMGDDLKRLHGKEALPDRPRPGRSEIQNELYLSGMAARRPFKSETSVLSRSHVITSQSLAGSANSGSV